MEPRIDTNFHEEKLVKCKSRFRPRYIAFSKLIYYSQHRNVELQKRRKYELQNRMDRNSCS